MDLTRRNLLRAAGALGGVVALGGGLAAEAVAGTSRAAFTARTTMDAVIAKGRPDAKGWRPLVRRAGEPHVVRAGLGAPALPGRASTRVPVLAFAQLSDVHILDAQSPMRFESQDSPDVSTSAYRPQEILTAHIAEAMVRELNAIASGPVTGESLAFALQTGDNSDNSQFNEIRWNIDLLDGELITPDSGDLTKYEGVMDLTPEFYDPYFWHPDGTPEGKQKDDPRRLYGFPVIPGLLDKARAPFQATGLAFPWYTAMGNHDELVQGNFKHNSIQQDRAVSGEKPNRVGGIRQVTPDPDRRLLSRAEAVEEHFSTAGLPEGHGFTEENRANGTAYYVNDTYPGVRFIVMDTVNANGGAEGSLDQAQFDWVKTQLASSANRLVIMASHHSSWTMDNARTDTSGSDTRVLGPELVAELLTHDNVIAWVNGHTHRNKVLPHTRQEGGGFWEINTASHIDWPQQSRLIEITDNQDGTLSIFTTMVDHGAPLSGGTLGGPMKLAALGRLLAANDWQERDSNRRGKKNARNVELIVGAPAFLAG